MPKAPPRGPQFNLRFSDEEMARLKAYCDRMSEEAGGGAKYTMTGVAKDALFEKIGAQEERWKRQGRKS